MGAERSENKWSGSGAVSGVAKNLRSGSGAERREERAGAERRAGYEKSHGALSGTSFRSHSAPMLWSAVRNRVRYCIT